MGLLSNLLKMKAEKEQQQRELQNALYRQKLQSQAAEREARAARRHSSSEKEKDRAASSGEAQADRDLREVLADRQREQRQSEFDTEQAVKQQEFDRAGTWRNEDIARNQERQQYLDDRKMEDRDTEEARYQEGLDREDRRLADSEILRNATREQARQKQFRDMVSDDPEAALRLYKTDPNYYSGFSGVTPEELADMSEDRRQKALEMERATSGIRNEAQFNLQDRLAKSARTAKSEEKAEELAGDPVKQAARRQAERSIALDEMNQELSNLGSGDIQGIKKIYDKAKETGSLGDLAEVLKSNKQFKTTIEDLKDQYQTASKHLETQQWHGNIKADPLSAFTPWSDEWYVKNLGSLFRQAFGQKVDPNVARDVYMNDFLKWLDDRVEYVPGK